MNKYDLKTLEHKYLRCCYEYYVLESPSMLDSDFDKMQNILSSEKSKVVDYVDFPSSDFLKKEGFNLELILDQDKKDEVKYKHWNPMLSLEKIQINDENQFPINALNNFFSRRYIKEDERYEASCKYDGNSMELNYIGGKLHQCLTRGDKIYGFDKTNRIKHIVPNEISIKDKKVQIRGEVVIDVNLWEEKYNNPEPGKVSNARNYVAGVLNRDEYNLKEIKELVFIAYDLVVMEDDKPSFIDNSMVVLENMGFNENYKPLIINFKGNIESFIEMYFKMKDYRDNVCPYLIDGIVIKYPEKHRKTLGETSHHPKHSIAIKYPTTEVSTYINDIEWVMGKNGDLSPVAILEPVELLGTIVSRCSLHNLGMIVKLGAFPGAKISLKKSGEIIPMITNVLEESKDKEKFLEYFYTVYNNK